MGECAVVGCEVSDWVVMPAFAEDSKLEGAWCRECEDVVERDEGPLEGDCFGEPDVDALLP